jgi:lysozyme
MDLARLHDDLIKDEGVRLSAYHDSQGILTIGVGHTGPEVSQGLVWGMDMVNATLDHDIEIAVGSLDKALPWWRDLNDVRQNVLANMCFNLGINRLLGFKNFLTALQEKRWDDASAHGMDSKWARQVPYRASRLMAQIKSGEWS